MKELDGEVDMRGLAAPASTSAGDVIVVALQLLGDNPSENIVEALVDRALE